MNEERKEYFEELMDREMLLNQEEQRKSKRARERCRKVFRRKRLFLLEAL